MRLGEKPTGVITKIYLGIDMARDKFDYCAIDDTLIFYAGEANRRIRRKDSKSYRI